MSFGPGPLSTALKGLIGATVGIFLLQVVAEWTGWNLTWTFSLRPVEVLERFQLWRVATYMFLHDPRNLFHLLFNMLALWMFGTELERIWGTRYFLKFYFVTGIGAGVLTALFSLLPFDFAAHVYGSYIYGASGAIFGLLLAYAMYFPEREMYLWMLFPVKTKYAVMIFGAIELFLTITGSNGVANATHLSGFVVAYLFLKGGRMQMHPWAEVKYRYLKWKINRARSRFDVYQGGRAKDWDRKVH